MRLSKGTLVSLSLVALANSMAAGEIMITEIMRNPSGEGTDRYREWFELFNPTDDAIDIFYWKIKDGKSDFHLIERPLVIQAGGYLVLGNNRDMETNGGVPVDYEYHKNDIHLNNDFADELILLDKNDVEVDRVRWDGGYGDFFFPNKDGASMALLDPALDNSVGSSWCNSITPYGGAGNKGTPGEANDCPPPQLVINEVMRQPYFGAGEREGEWFELFNPTNRPMDINGWLLKDNGSNRHVISNQGPLVVKAGGYLVLGNNADKTTNANVTVDYQYDQIYLNNDGDELILMAASVVVDYVSWNWGSPGSLELNNHYASSMSLMDPSLDNSVASNWCNSNTWYSWRVKATPGTKNSCTGPPLVINEIMQYSANVALDRHGEWFELYNPTRRPVDIEGWAIKCDETNKHVINTGGQLIISPRGYLVLGNNADIETNGNVSLAYEYAADRIFLNSDQDELVLSAGQVEIDRVNWGGAFPMEEGVAMELLDPSLDNNVGSNWCSALAYGNDKKGTPGSPNSCPVPQLVINELMINPTHVSTERVGEWIELYNPSDKPIDINGWTLKDYGIYKHTIDSDGPLVVQPGGYLVLGNGEKSVNGGVALDYQYNSTEIYLNNDRDELILAAGAKEVDRVEWNFISFPSQDGAAMALKDPALDNNLATSWCNAVTVYGDGHNFGTPGAANDCPFGWFTHGGLRG